MAVNVYLVTWMLGSKTFSGIFQSTSFAGSIELSQSVHRLPFVALNEDNTNAHVRTGIRAVRWQFPPSAGRTSELTSRSFSFRKLQGRSWPGCSLSTGKHNLLRGQVTEALFTKKEKLDIK
jgi:hypothetical protein